MPEIIVPEPPLTELTNAFIDATLKYDTRPFANGQRDVNNHSDGAYGEIHDEALRDIVAEHSRDLLLGAEVGDGAAECELDFIAPVPAGAVGWAYAIARQMNRPRMHVLNLDKRARREFALNEFSELQLENLIAVHERPAGVVLDDVSSDGGTGEAMAEFLESQGLEVTLILSLLFRGDITQLKSKYNRAFVMQQHIPYKIDWAKRRGSGLIVAEAGQNA